MKIQRLFISYVLVTPVFVILLVVLLVMSWTIEKYQLKK
jgi:hypothetical protein